MPPPLPSVIRCPRELRPAALRQVHDAMPGDQQSVLAQVLLNVGLKDERVWDGLLIALSEPWSGDDIASIDGAIWVQRAAGNTAVVWTPAVNSPVYEALLRGAAEFIDADRIPLAQMVVSAEDGYCEAMLSRCGFPRFAKLSYLFAETSAVPSGATHAAGAESAEQWCEGLHFVSRAGDEPQRLAALLEQTYVDTLDCPGLDGVRPMDEVLEGYRQQGRHRPQDWYVVQDEGVDVGALLLTEHPGVDNWELVYMGLVPAARGRGCGLRIIRFALDIAAQHGAERLVLAVDAANNPALRAYERAGFIVWDQRIVYARLRATA